MRAAFTVAALAASALAVPFAANEKRQDVVYDVNTVYVTNVVTVTGGEQPAPTQAPQQHYGHNIWATTWVVTEQAAPSSQAAPAPSSQQQAPSPVAPSSAAAPSSASGAAPTGYQDTCIFHHNLHRANHSVPDIEWSDDLAASAQQIANLCVYAHNLEVAGGGYGQNIAAGVESDNISAVITDLFYNGEVLNYEIASNNYQLANPDMSNFEDFGHMTQLVWKGTTQVGCATQYCPNGLANVGSDVPPYFTVCNYGPPGNYAGEYGANIPASKGEPTVQWNAS